MVSKMGNDLIAKSKDRRRSVDQEALQKALGENVSLSTNGATEEGASSSEQALEYNPPENKPVAKAEHKIFSINPLQDEAIEKLRRKALCSKIPGRSDILRAGIAALADMDAKQLGDLLDEVHAAQSDGQLHEDLYKVE